MGVLFAALFAATLLLRLGGDLLRSRGRVHKLTFFVQNFMDAEHLEQGRIQACSFMVMTDTGPVSMCEHNARRDDYILKPLNVTQRDGTVERYKHLVWRGSAAEAGSVM